MTNKQIAISFLQTAGLGDPREAYAKYVATDFIHHNQYFKGDRASLMEAMIEASKSSPNESYEVQQAAEEGDRVFVHSHVKKKDMDITVVHIFRFQDGKIVELWDLGQEVMKDSPNENGAF